MYSGSSFEEATHDAEILESGCSMSDFDARSYWDSRARLGFHAGGPDTVLKHLEMRAIASHVNDGMRILDAGCGNGLTAIALATEFDVSVIGIDFSSAMLEAARENLVNATLKGTIDFQLHDIHEPFQSKLGFDLVYTERTIINLLTWQEQEKAILDLLQLTNLQGQYIMCEASQDGLARINTLRNRVGLESIKPPWHNRYIRDNEIARLSHHLVRVDDFSATYYFLSRIVNAWMAQKEERKLSYDDLLNLLALELPPIGDAGQARIWIWSRNGT